MLQWERKEAVVAINDGRLFLNFVLHFSEWLDNKIEIDFPDQVFLNTTSELCITFKNFSDDQDYFSMTYNTMPKSALDNTTIQVYSRSK